MKFCTYCGQQLSEEAVICPKCGCATGVPFPNQKSSGIKTATKIFMILGCVVMGLYIIPLCWVLPMTIVYCNRSSRGIPMGVGFKVCTLLFVSLIAGILMLCDNDDPMPVPPPAVNNPYNNAPRQEANHVEPPVNVSNEEAPKQEEPKEEPTDTPSEHSDNDDFFKD